MVDWARLGTFAAVPLSAFRHIMLCSMQSEESSVKLGALAGMGIGRVDWDAPGPVSWPRGVGVSTGVRIITSKRPKIQPTGRIDSLVGAVARASSVDGNNQRVNVA